MSKQFRFYIAVSYIENGIQKTCKLIFQNIDQAVEILQAFDVPIIRERFKPNADLDERNVTRTLYKYSDDTVKASLEKILYIPSKKRGTA